MSVFDEKRAELEKHEFMMGVERGRLAVALDLLTDSLIMVGQHGVYCASSRNPRKPALDLQAVLSGHGRRQGADSVGDGGVADAAGSGARLTQSRSRTPTGNCVCDWVTEKSWCARRDSNSRPNAPEAFALSS